MSSSSQELGQLRRWLEPRSIREKLLLLYAVVIGAISVFVFAYFPSAIGDKIEAGMFETSQALGALASASLESAVVFDDRQAMLNVLGRFTGSSDVLRAEVFVGGLKVAEWIRAEVALPDESMLVISDTPINFGGETVGTLRLKLTRDRLVASVGKARLKVAMIAILIFTIGSLTVVVISEHVTRPLRRIVKTANRIAAGRIRERAPIETADELGQMAASFNRMVDQLETAHSQVEASYEQLTEIMDHLPAEVALFDLDHRYRYVNPAGISVPEHREWVIGRTPVEYCQLRGVDPAYGTEAERLMDDCIAERRTVRFDQTLILPNDQERHFIRLLVPVTSSCSKTVQILGYGVDVTEQVLAEEALRESEGQLLQAQRMESIGKLAGGVAHDFNNLLTAITGHSELLLLDLSPDDPLREEATEIRKAADRAAGLTKQLLAFSRKQVMRSEVLDVNERVRSIENMLRRLIGEHIELEVSLEAVDPVEADPAQLEQAILNLAVNARDAMPTGGLLRIATETVVVNGSPDLDPGRYVRLVVTDTGTGMDEQTRNRVFEPFFTTKDPGKGTGLGLSTVHGILNQTGGSVTCYSEVGVGTIFKIYLPSAERRQAMETSDESEPAPIGGMETILVTEDQENVRNLAVAVLSRLGYKVLSAGGSAEALAIAEQYEDPIDLLLTDVVMPGMTGPEVAQRITAIRPDTAVIFMSGYTDDALDRHGVKATTTNYLEKPFTPDLLADVVRRRLDSESAATTEITTADTA